MQTLYQRAQEVAQEHYRKSRDYAFKSLSVAVQNVVLTNKLPEPSYEDTRPQSFYREEMIALMNMLHDEEIRNLKAKYEKESNDG